MNLIAEWMQTFFYNFFWYNMTRLYLGSDEIIKILQMWLNNPQEGQKFPIFLCDNHQGESSHIDINWLFDVTNVYFLEHSCMFWVIWVLFCVKKMVSSWFICLYGFVFLFLFYNIINQLIFWFIFNIEMKTLPFLSPIIFDY